MSVPTPILQYNLSDATIKGLLPDGYTPLAYIEFPGSGGGIDLGYKFNALTDSYEIEFLASDTTQNGMILASHGTYYSWLYYYGNALKIKTYITDSNGDAKNRGDGPNDLHKHIVRYHDRKWYIDIGDSSATGTYEAYSFVQDTNNLCLGGYNTSSSSHPFKGKIYRVKIWHNDVLQRDLIPASHSSGNGYYDLVTKTFYTRTELIAGPELAVGKGGGKSLPEEYLLVEYLQMDPGLYINTGQAIAIDDVTKTEVWMWYADGNTRDLMGWSLSAAEYWGCTANSTWEKVTGVSPITQRQKVVYNHTAAAAGTYQIGAVSRNYSTRTKYIELVKITIGGSLKRNLYACYRKSDGKPGMYDTVNGVFYTNTGSGEFILGPSITNCYNWEPNCKSPNFCIGYNQGQEVTLNTYNSTGSFTQFLNNLFAITDYSLTVNRTYTVSFDAISPNGTSELLLYNSNSTPRYFYYSKSLGNVTTSWQHYSYTFTSLDRGSGNAVSHPVEIYAPSKTGVKIRNLSIYEGSIDWSTATNRNGLYTNLSGIYDSSKGWVADFNKSTALLTGNSPSNDVRSVAFWMRPNTLTSGALDILLVDYKSRIGFGKLSNGNWCTSTVVNTSLFTASISANNWYHVVIVNDGSSNTATNRKLYINGVLQSAVSSTEKWNSPGDRLDIGKRSSSSDGFNGQICNFMMFTSALTEKQVKELYGE